MDGTRCAIKTAYTYWGGCVNIRLNGLQEKKILPEVKKNDKGNKTNISVYVHKHSLKIYEAKIDIIIRRLSRIWVENFINCLSGIYRITSQKSVKT